MRKHSAISQSARSLLLVLAFLVVEPVSSAEAKKNTKVVWKPHDPIFFGNYNLVEADIEGTKSWKQSCFDKFRDPNRRSDTISVFDTDKDLFPFGMGNYTEISMLIPDLVEDQPYYIWAPPEENGSKEKYSQITWLSNGSIRIKEYDDVPFQQGMQIICRWEKWHIPLNARSSGDPHFKTWSDENFDFHGGCDLVLFQDPTFANGLGLTIHIRTKIETWWSFIEAAVVKIGDQTMEIMGNEARVEGPIYWVNGFVGNKEVEKDGNLKDFKHLLSAEMKGFSVSYRQVNPTQHRFRIDLNGAGDAIGIETFKSWVSVNVKAVRAENFKNTMGMMGAYPSGKKLARNGTMVIEDPILFGKEWQVLESEPMLFHSSKDSVQAPQECAMPTSDTAEKTKRRLGESLVTNEEAKLACDHAAATDLDACIFDVLATNDKEMAGAY